MSASSERISAIARGLIAARNGTPGEALSGPLDQPEAYEIQKAVVAALGPAGAFKSSRKPGSQPLAAPILARDIVPSGSLFPPAPDGRMGIELEVGFRFIAPPPDPAAPDFEARLRQAAVPLAVIELCATRLPPALADDPAWKLADNLINAGLVTGTGPATMGNGAYKTVRATLRLGDRLFHDGPAEVPGGGFDVLAGTVRDLGSHCGGLKTGHVLITGSLTPLIWVEAGTEVSGRIEGIGEVSVRIA